MKTKMLGVLCFSLLLMSPVVEAAYYSGSDQCFECHTDQFNYWQSSGHPWKLRKAEQARYSKLPLPPGYSWDEISYVIGGAIRKARFIDLEGYIITSAKDGTEAKTQYNVLDGSWSFYHKGEKKPYKCGPCHMTGYSSEGNQDGRPGMIGTWPEDGIGCEECHGPGSDHVQNPGKGNIKVDKSAEACGKCHQRGGINMTPPAKGGFVRHHEQINELYAGPHSELDCVKCHNPHQRAVLTDKGVCAECHDGKAASFPNTLHGKTGLECISCHMPKATKSAVAESKYVGDMRTHIFRINSDPKANMFATEEKGGKKSSYAKGFVTLDFVCLGCHQGRDIEWASKNAKNIHK